MLRNDHFFSIAGHFSRASRRMPIFLRDQMPEERLGVGGRVSEEVLGFALGKYSFTSKFQF